MKINFDTKTNNSIKVGDIVSYEGDTCLVVFNPLCENYPYLLVRVYDCKTVYNFTYTRLLEVCTLIVERDNVQLSLVEVENGSSNQKENS